MSGKITNIAASIAARLLKRAKETGEDYQTLLTSFCFERFLYRLAASSARDRFVLKGAMLLRVWSDQPYRTTRDLDLLRRGDASLDAILGDIRIVCETVVEPDGVIFDPNAARIEAIRPEDEAFAKLLGSFLNPILDDLRQPRRDAGVWMPGGPWR